jgi:uncharacterized RDD family membrane protein YckC
MTQPPDDGQRRPSDPEPPDAADAADQPTVQWTPPDSRPEPVAPVVPGPAEPPLAPPPEPSSAGAAEPAPAPPTTPTSDEAAAGGPLISSTPSSPLVGWQQPGSQAAPPVVGWQVQDAGAEPAPVEGYVIAGPWARLVAWLIDSLLVTFIPSVLSFVIIDWAPLVAAMVEQAQDPSATPTSMFMPMSVEAFIVSLIGVGLSYLYFVGFWTGPWMATPGMRLMRMRVGDEQRGGILSLTAATKRWFAMGAWLALLAYVGSMATIAGLGGQLLQVVLFISVIVNARRQGLHDRFAGSLVMRDRASGDGAVGLGCLVLVALIVLASIIFGIIFFNVVWPAMEPVLDELVVPS